MVPFFFTVDCFFNAEMKIYMHADAFEQVFFVEDGVVTEKKDMLLACPRYFSFG